MSKLRANFTNCSNDITDFPYISVGIWSITCGIFNKYKPWIDVIGQFSATISFQYIYDTTILTLKCVVITKGHIYLNKPAAESCRFVYVHVTFLLPPWTEHLTHNHFKNTFLAVQKFYSKISSHYISTKIFLAKCKWKPN